MWVPCTLGKRSDFSSLIRASRYERLIFLLVCLCRRRLCAAPWRPPTLLGLRGSLALWGAGPRFDGMTRSTLHLGRRIEKVFGRVSVSCIFLCPFIGAMIYLGNSRIHLVTLAFWSLTAWISQFLYWRWDTVDVDSHTCLTCRGHTFPKFRFWASQKGRRKGLPGVAQATWSVFPTGVLLPGTGSLSTPVHFPSSQLFCSFRGPTIHTTADLWA